MPVEVSARLVDYQGKKIIQSVVRDISERKLAEDLIWASKEEKRILLDELRERSRFQAWLCDRVKHLIEEAREKSIDLTILESHVERVKAMAFIEDRVFRSLSFSMVEVIPLLRALVSYLIDLNRLGTCPVFVESEIEDLKVDLNHALRVSYLSFELITNAIRHAFPDGREGTITLNLSKNDDFIRLTVRDNGIGVPDSGKILPDGKLGGVVIEELVRRLGGQSSMNGKGGTSWEIRFS
jgi:two-component sensor histidine kinase